LFQLVRLRNGTHCIHSLEYGETHHVGLGPAAEATALYVEQLEVVERLKRCGELVAWDVGLGGAANALAVIRASAGCDGRLCVASFDQSAEPLRFAVEQAGALGYLDGFLEPVSQLLNCGFAEFTWGRVQVTWKFILADFPAWLASGRRAASRTEGLRTEDSSR